MRFRFMLACVAVSLGVGMAGCSNEEPPAPPAKSPKVVRKIMEPLAEPVREAARNPQTSEQAIPESETPSAPPPAKTAVDAPGVSEDSTGLSPAEAVNAPETGATESQKAPSEENVDGSRTGASGVYAVKSGDCLAVIAGREDVFGDPLKWPILFQLNRDALKDVPLDERLPERRLPNGIQLRFTRSEEERARAQERPDPVWVVNLISSPTADRIDGPAVELMKRGYPVYISRATVKGQKWMRLRVGFFQDRTGAVKAGKELQNFLDLRDSWPVRIGPEETAEYAEILMPLQKG